MFSMSLNFVGRNSRLLKRLSLLLFLFITACSGGFDHNIGSMNNGGTEFISNGERIYFTGRSASGSVITASGEGSRLRMHRRMQGGGCAGCHGADREGRRLMPRFWIKAPALTSEALFGDDDHGDESDGHGDHDKYDAETLRLVISKGIEPSGEKLDSAMPRWSMSDANLNDLIDYLQQSHEH